ncbi:hypothetical protein [Komagataeibacter oboediens]|uniref:hypothetical protein n=1 Tax=Komagataeibacter oboediens TaxID=65958 RepID=UPI001C2CCA99|nr:hypothetical protein [Komagataeibacter oboediens]MBV1824824.1 hypothetical protein [Komagataeibacter oboediens]
MSIKSGDIVLVDTNLIIQGHMKRCWSAISGAYRLQTVDQCIVEAMTGDHSWNNSRPIEEKLRQGFDAIHSISDQQLAEVLVRGGSLLDAGEQHLWAYALSCPTAWVLCGPDRASMRFGYEQSYRERLVSLEELLNGISTSSPIPIDAHHTKKWLNDFINDIILGIIR